MLSLTKKTEYALIAVSHLARTAERVVSAREIAGRYALRLPLLMNVLKRLHQRGLVRSTRGSRGGYMLACAPDKLTLSMLVRAMDGPVRLVQCAPQRDSYVESCELMASCPVRGPLNKLHARFNEFLGEVTVADVAFDDEFDALRASEQLRVLVQ